MDWRKGFNAEYYITNVDPITWSDMERHKIESGSIKKESSGLLQSADINIGTDVDSNEHWIRVWLIAKQDGDSQRVPMFTGLACAPEDSWRGFTLNGTYECYSVLKPCEDVFLPRGWFAPAGADGATLIQKLLRATTPAPISLDGVSKSLKSAIIAEENENHLTMAQKIANACELRIKINGMGEITILPEANTSVTRIDYTDNDIVKPEIEISNDWYSLPNVFRAIEDDLMAEVRDESDDSPLSIQNRGREIWAQESNCDLNQDETIAEYAKRKLAELQSKSITVKYNRRFIPDVEPTDTIEFNIPKIGLQGYYQINSQSIDLSYGAEVSEESTKIWQG